ncbi:hypothetical protein L7F22_022215 [Adiantum nelumboides]|nr:hypothetical protein [Adiantum nelumboides]
MKELTALKKSKASQNSSRKPPLREGLSSSTHTYESSSTQPLTREAQPNSNRDVYNHDDLYYQEYRGRLRDGSHAGINPDQINAVPARSPRKSTHQSDSTSIRSPPMNDYNAKIMNWNSEGDAPRHGATSSTTPFAEHLQHESLQNHLERLGILGGGRELHEQMLEASSLLRNWKNVDEGPSQGHHFENFELERSPRAWNQHESAQDNAATKSCAYNFFARKGGQGVGEYVPVSQKASIWQEEGQRVNDQALSPLMLNPNDDNHQFGQYGTNPNFCLDEESLYEDNAQEELRHKNKERLWTSLSREPRGSHSPLRPDRKQTAAKCSRPFDIHSPPFGFRPGTSETEFLEYDVETLEQPSKRRERPSSRKEEHPFTREHAGYSFDSVKPARRNSTVGSKQKYQLNSSYMSSRSPEVPPLPLLTEVEDYNGSDEYGETSVDGGDFERSPMTAHQDGLQLARRRSQSVGGHDPIRKGGADRLQLSVRNCTKLALSESHPRNLSQKYRGQRPLRKLLGNP